MSAASSWHPQALNFDTLFTVKIVGPKGLFGVTSGRLQEHFSDGVTTTVVWQSRYPQDSLTLAAGYYQLQEQQLGDIQLLVLLSPQNSSLASDYLESLREYMALYQKLFGPYPYEKFAV
ncbi:MAG: M1 family metallopeptidase, partial [Gammaproteobacteria bacterium]|nr:M1 family metallopeptidase [Gammaproteobacteria bacterium]NIR49910.1 M1 family metallopeptidase [candidate division KSB1 bacterium]NIS25333.1 M1 family metallopeptidase [candidate division KSB1 bacterium]NIU26052.1 M1 family metallopeptidase [candidate division KSB1 bacterium]NIV91329.1 M1 family peptidase [candidate division KSB1 bacterium]